MSHRVSFVLANTDHGAMIVNRFDYTIGKDGVHGVGLLLLEFNAYQEEEVNNCKRILTALHDSRGKGVVALDVGANIGCMTIPWAQHMRGWGEVLAFEPQERTYYALCGNIILNNLLNARASNVAVGIIHGGMIDVPIIDTDKPSDSGSVSLLGGDKGFSRKVRLTSIDGLALTRCDFIKIDIEGMEVSALKGAVNTLKKLRPILWVENAIVGEDTLKAILPEYCSENVGLNTLFIHREDPICEQININRLDS